MIRTILPALALAALLPPAALAAQVIKVPPFKSIELHGGGQAVLRHGDRQRVVLLKGDPKVAEIRITGDGKLMLSPCRHWCWGSHELEVEVTTPSVAAISVHGGGELKAERGFPAQPSLALSVHGGGDADVRAIPAGAVSVEVHGGGDVRFWGHPRVTSSTHGGGSVESGE